jgi:AcrR family transcriptional regulator
MGRGRPREFDEENALQQAMLVFWRQGYRGTSLDDLTQALAINKPSLYAAFGDKETLFLKVVDHYRDRMIVPAARKLLESEDLIDGLNAFFQAFAKIVLENDTPPGCLIACLLSEECCESDAIKTKLAGLIESADKAFSTVFQRHQKQLNPALTPESAGRLLASTVHGLSVRARAGASKKTILEICAAFIDAVAVP